LDDLVLMPEVTARKMLAGQPLTFTTLVPIGPFAGRGTLRVLRARPRGESVELVCGYESYVPLLAKKPGPRV
jgi:hypothetical protein